MNADAQTVAQAGFFSSHQEGQPIHVIVDTPINTQEKWGGWESLEQTEFLALSLFGVACMAVFLYGKFCKTQRNSPFYNSQQHLVGDLDAESGRENIVSYRAGVSP
jgi:hypothetical protein